MAGTTVSGASASWSWKRRGLASSLPPENPYDRQNRSRQRHVMSLDEQMPSRSLPGQMTKRIHAASYCPTKIASLNTSNLMTDRFLKKTRPATGGSGLVPLTVSRAAAEGHSDAYTGVGEQSERWRSSVERMLRNCPGQADLTYVEQLLARLKAEKFEEGSDTVTAIRAAKAQRSAAAAKRRLRSL